MGIAYPSRVSDAISGAKGAMAKPISTKPKIALRSLAPNQSNAAPRIMPKEFKRKNMPLPMRVMMKPTRNR